MSNATANSNDSTHSEIIAQLMEFGYQEQDIIASIKALNNTKDINEIIDDIQNQHQIQQDTLIYNDNNKNVPTHTVLFLGGWSKMHDPLKRYYEQYSTKKVDFIAFKTKELHKTTPQKLADKFKEENRRIIGICNLMDNLVPFTDELHKLCNLPYNDTTTSQIRRNKALMHSTINKFEGNDDEKSEKRTVRYGKYFKIDSYLNETEFEEKMKKNNISYPIVIKPPTSGGTEGVRLCYTFIAAQKVIKKHLKKENCEHDINEIMMAQEFLDGNEYVVNAVSYGGNHKFCDIWRAYKSFQIDKSFESQDDDNNNDENNDDDDDDNKEEDDDCYPYAMLYSYQEFETDIIGNKTLQQIAEYVEQILNILGVKYGASHTEVMWIVKEKRTCLIELNARFHGGLPRANELVGYNQMELLALSHTDIDKFNNINKYYKCKQNKGKKDHVVTVRSIFLKSRCNGRVNFDKICGFEKLKTFKKFGRELVSGTKYYKDWKNHLFQHHMELKAVVYDELEKIELEIKTNPIFQYAEMFDFDVDVLLSLPDSMKMEVIPSNFADEILNFLNIYQEQIQRKDIIKQTNTNEKQEIIKEINRAKRVIGQIEKCEKTIDLLSCPGIVILEGKISDIELDYKRIRDLEMNVENGLYREQM